MCRRFESGQGYQLISCNKRMRIVADVYQLEIGNAAIPDSLLSIYIDENKLFRARMF